MKVKTNYHVHLPVCSNFFIICPSQKSVLVTQNWELQITGLANFKLKNLAPAELILHWNRIWVLLLLNLRGHQVKGRNQVCDRSYLWVHQAPLIKLHLATSVLLCQKLQHVDATLIFTHHRFSILTTTRRNWELVIFCEASRLPAGDRGVQRQFWVQGIVRGLQWSEVRSLLVGLGCVWYPR